MPPEDPELARWFAAELQPHEPMLRAWLHNRFSTECEIDDVIQETYMRVLQARESTQIVAPKAFLFAIARNVALGRMKYRNVRGENSLVESDLSAILDESTDVPNAVARAQELELLTHAIQSLPDRCRQVFTLRRIYGMSQREVAAHLGITERTVEAQGTIGVKKIADYFDRFDRRGPPL